MYRGGGVLTQRDSLGELVLQGEDLAEGPQELQNHQSFSKEVGGQTGPHWDGTGQLLMEATDTDPGSAGGREWSQIQVKGFSSH